MKVETQLTLADYAALSAFLVRERLAPHRPKHLMILIGAVGIPVWLLSYGLRHEMTPVGVVLGGAGAAAWILFASHLNRRWLKPAPDGSILGAKTVTLGDEGIRQVSAHQETLFKWTAVRTVGETPRHFFVLVDTIAGIIIPKGAFGSPRAAKDWGDELRRRTGK